ncbi:hypothetical protein ONV78_28895 [Hahella sp. CR1]|uniref:hypothetical protein n=1 Tax=Hahella sp. CR1 TaxID=2992807 RepID=UPI0024432B80|nr:hypothetical protein [Hahella sp. CR1]MDG9671788.1 hypothetical protein [Hahella sp. CR1]
MTDADKGLPAVVRGQTKIDGKKFIEEQLLLMMGAFSPIYANGEMGLRRRTAIMSSGSYVRELNAGNLLKVGALRFLRDNRLPQRPAGAPGVHYR